MRGTDRVDEFGRRTAPGGSGTDRGFDQPGWWSEPAHDRGSGPVEPSEGFEIAGTSGDERGCETPAELIHALEVEPFVPVAEVGPEHVEQGHAVDRREEHAAIGYPSEEGGRLLLGTGEDGHGRGGDQLFVLSRVDRRADELQLHQLLVGGLEIADGRESDGQPAARDSAVDDRSPVDPSGSRGGDLFEYLHRGALCLSDRHLHPDHAVAHAISMGLGHPLHRAGGLIDAAELDLRAGAQIRGDALGRIRARIGCNGRQDLLRLAPTTHHQRERPGLAGPDINVGA